MLRVRELEARDGLLNQSFDEGLVSLKNRNPWEASFKSNLRENDDAAIIGEGKICKKIRVPGPEVLCA